MTEETIRKLTALLDALPLSKDVVLAFLAEQQKPVSVVKIKAVLGRGRGYTLDVVGGCVDRGEVAEHRQSYYDDGRPAGTYYTITDEGRRVLAHRRAAQARYK